MAINIIAAGKRKAGSILTNYSVSHERWPAVVGKAQLPVARLFGSSDAFDDFVEYPREVAVVVESVDAANEAHHHSVEEGQDRSGLIVDEAGIGWLFGILPSSDGLARQGREV